MKFPKSRILIVDDKEEILITLKLFLQEHFEHIITEKNPNNIPSLFHEQNFDVVILDMNFKAGINTGNEGIFWMKKIIDMDPQAVIIFITAYGDVELAVKAVKEGAADFIQKPWDDNKMLATVISAWKLRKSKQEITSLKYKKDHLNEKINKEYDFFKGPAESMQSVYDTIDKVSDTEANVLILGENGTGKELFARELHRKSYRAKEMFVSVDLAALSESIFESELFGHVKGSYTDAKEDRPGRFEIVSGGTLFLDEIGNLSQAMQSKLLTVLQNREITRLGSNKIIPVDVRIISATNKNLSEMVEKDSFREDLLYRINTIQIELPSLRERLEDIPLLLEFFLKKYSEKYKKQITNIPASVLKKLQAYHWPGNIRELQHKVEKAVIMADTNNLTVSDFFQHNVSHKPDKDLKTLNLEENEKIIIKRAVENNQGNISVAVKELGISRKTLYNKLKKYGL
ncbi:sigma-54-dependent transcriptional regulator [Bacteroidota bacterium]